MDLKEEDIKSSPVQEKSEANCDSVSDSGCPDSTKCDTKMEEGNEAVTPKNEDIERVTESPMEVDDNPAPIISESDEEIKAIAEEKVKELVEIIASQKVDDSTGTHNTKEKDEEKVSPDVKPVAKPETEASKDSDQKLQKEIDALVKKIQDQAIALLEDWKRLKESFKIPKRELVKMRAEHEREVDRAAARFQEQPHHHRDMAPSSSRAGFLHPEHHHPPKHHHSSHHLQHQQQPHHHHHHHHQQHVQAHHHKPFQSSYERNRPARPESPTNTKRERRISRFDDQTGFLQKTDLSREHRRQLFSLKAETEEKEKRKRLLQQQQHENKCYYLRLDPALTPMFAQYPEFYFDDMAGQWIPMPEPYPEIEVNWGYAGMAHLPLEAFQIIDPPLPDPAYVYPPGVVPVSYLFGPPPDEQQQNHQEPELLPPLPPDQADSADSTSRPPPPEYVPFLSSEPNSNNSIPFLGGEARAGPYNMQPDYDLASQEQHPDPVQNPSALDNGGFFPGMDMAAGANGSSSSIGGRQGNSSRLTERPNVVIKLPPRWKTCKDAEGRLYFYNTKTKEAQWDPPPDSVQDDDHDPTKELLDEDDVTMVEIENNDETNGEGGNDEDGDTDDEDDDEEEVDKRNAEEIDLMSSDSDLSAHEKELLLAKKKTKEERQHERRQKRERDREKREYERKRRRERHGRHRKEGLVIEHFIPVRNLSKIVLI